MPILGSTRQCFTPLLHSPPKKIERDFYLEKSYYVNLNIFVQVTLPLLLAQESER